MTNEELCAALARPEMEPLAYLVRHIVKADAEIARLTAALASSHP